MASYILPGFLVLSILTACSMFGGGQSDGDTGPIGPSGGGTGLGGIGQPSSLSACVDYCNANEFDAESKLECRDGCRVAEGKRMKDVRYCDLLEETDLIPTCYGFVGSALGNPGVCDSLDADGREECLLIAGMVPQR